MCDWVLSGLRLLVGLDLQALLGLDLVLNKIVKMISCTSESKPLALPWGWTPRLDSDVRVRKHVVRKVCDFLAAHPAPFWKFLESFLCLVGIIRYYELDDNVYPVFLADDDEEMDLFAFINHADTTKVQIVEKKIKEGQVPLLESTRGRVVPLAGVNEQGNQNDDVQDVAHGVQDEGVNIVSHEEVEATAADKPKVQKKRRRADGASGSDHPPKKLREDHGTSRDVSANTGGKSLVVIQDVFERSTLNVEVSVMVAATMPFFTSSVTLSSEREGGRHTDSVSRPNLRTKHPTERFVTSSDSSHHSSTNAADDEVTSIVRSLAPPPSVIIAAIATTAIASATSALIYEWCTGPVQRSIFRDSASPSTTEADIVDPFQPAGVEVSTDTFYISQKMDSETLHMVDQLAPPRCVLVLSLKAQLSLKESEAAEAIRLRIQVAAIEATESAQVNELKSLKGWTTDLEGQVVALESVIVIKDNELASSNAQITKLTKDLSNFQLSCYELFKEQIKAVQDEQLKFLSDKVAGLDAELMGMALHLDEEFYPRFLTTIAGRKWILGLGLRLVVMKCLQSPEYLAALGGAIGRAIYKGIQDGLATGIDHGKAGRGLVDVAAYNPSTEANYVSAVNALRAVDFPLLSQLESQKDASIADFMGLFHLEDVVHAHDQRIRGDAASQHLSISDTMVPLIELLSAENLVGEASLSGLPAAVVATTTLSTTFVQASSVPPVPASNYEVVETEPQAEASSSPKIIFD
ncbi:hypothetical protein Tco_0933610 [Tanacetum coccineum]